MTRVIESGEMTDVDAAAVTGSLEEQAYDAVIAWLSQGEVKPGEPLPLRELSKKLGMSRTPLRAAVGRLHEQGLVAYSARYGFSVAVPTMGDLYELFDLRAMCETHALRRYFERYPGAAERQAAWPDEIDALAHAGLELAGEIVTDPAKYPAFSATDGKFHQAIVALGESRRLSEWYDQLSLRAVIFRLGWTVPMSEERFRTSAREHLAVVDAAQRGDSEGARRLLEAHLIRVRDQTIERLMRAGTVPALGR
jgi:DNA-binding GntR family transcriptional regulator